MSAWVRRLLVVEDEPLMRSLLSELLQERGYEVAVAANVEQAVALLASFDPDAVLLDIELGAGPRGIDVAHLITRKYPHTAIVFLTRHSDIRAAGFTEADLPERYAFLRKDLVDEVDSLNLALESALRETPTLPRHDQEGSPLTRLTNDQFSVLRLVAEGWTNASIAASRGTSERSVERLLRAAFDALGLPDTGDVNRRVDAVRTFITYAGVPHRAPQPD